MNLVFVIELDFQCEQEFLIVLFHIPINIPCNSVGEGREGMNARGQRNSLTNTTD